MIKSCAALRGIRSSAVICAIASPCGGRRLGAAQPPQTEPQHDGRGDHAGPGTAKVSYRRTAWGWLSYRRCSSSADIVRSVPRGRPASRRIQPSETTRAPSANTKKATKTDAPWVTNARKHDRQHGATRSQSVSQKPAMAETDPLSPSACRTRLQAEKSGRTAPQVGGASMKVASVRQKRLARNGAAIAPRPGPAARAAPIGQRYQQDEGNKDADKPHGLRHPLAEHRGSASSDARGHSRGDRGRLARNGAPHRAACKENPIRRSFWKRR